MTQASEYEVVWTGTLERQRADAIRAEANYARSKFEPRTCGEMNSNQRVLACLVRQPDATMLEIAGSTGIKASTVNGSLHRLLELGYVVRSHSQKQSRKQHIRWRVKA